MNMNGIGVTLLLFLASYFNMNINRIGVTLVLFLAVSVHNCSANCEYNERVCLSAYGLQDYIQAFRNSSRKLINRCNYFKEIFLCVKRYLPECTANYQSKTNNLLDAWSLICPRDYIEIAPVHPYLLHSFVTPTVPTQSTPDDNYPGLWELLTTTKKSIPDFNWDNYETDDTGDSKRNYFSEDDTGHVDTADDTERNTEYHGYGSNYGSEDNRDNVDTDEDNTEYENGSEDPTYSSTHYYKYSGGVVIIFPCGLICFLVRRRRLRLLAVRGAQGVPQQQIQQRQATQQQVAQQQAMQQQMAQQQAVLAHGPSPAGNAPGYGSPPDGLPPHYEAGISNVPAPDGLPPPYEAHGQEAYAAQISGMDKDNLVKHEV